MASAHSDELDITLDREAELPVGVQLTWALRTRILGGAIRRGHKLPALHRLADDLGVNANTIRAAYVRLEQEGLVETRHGSGTYVTGSPTDQTALTHLAATAARAARDAGIDPREVAAALYVGSDDPVAPDGEAAARRRLRAQISALEQTLTELTAGQPPTPGPARPARPRLLTAVDLERQRTDLLRLLVAAQAEADAGETDHTTAAAPPTPAKRPRKAGARPASLRAAPRGT